MTERITTIKSVFCGVLVIMATCIFISSCAPKAQQATASKPFWGIQEPFNLEAVKEAAEAGVDTNYIETLLGKENVISYGLRAGMSMDMYKCLLELGCDPNGKNTLQQPLTFAALNEGRDDLMFALLDFGADINTQVSGKSLLDVAVEKNNESAANELLERGLQATVQTLELSLEVVKGDAQDSSGGAQTAATILKYLESQNKTTGLTPILRAAILGDSQTVIALASNGSDSPEQTTLLTCFVAAFCNHDALEVLQNGGMLAEEGAVDIWATAIRYGNTDVLIYEIEKKPTHDYGRTHLAIVYNQTAVVELLLANGAIAAIQPQSGGSSSWEVFENELSIAAGNGNLQIIETLLKYGYPINDLAAFTAAKSALNSGHFDIVEYFVQQGLDINYVDGDNGNLLWSACADGTLDSVRYALQAGVTVDASCLEVAVVRGRTEIVALLLDSGADPNKTVEYSKPALINAINGGYFDIVKDLVEYGADVNEVGYTNSEMTEYEPAICVAARAPSSRILEYLINQGAEINVTNSDGQTPLDCVQMSKTMNPANEKILMDAAKANMGDRGDGT